MTEGVAAGFTGNHPLNVFHSGSLVPFVPLW